MMEKIISVDVEAGYEVVERIKIHVARTERLGVMVALGGFGGMFDLIRSYFDGNFPTPLYDYEEPYLKSLKEKTSFYLEK